MRLGTFICGSVANADNRRMHRPSAPVPVRCPVRPRLGVSAMLAGLLLATLAPLPVWGDDKGDHERARAAVGAGEVLPLAVLLERLRRSHPGRVLELELERDDGRWIYEVKLLQADGQLLKLEVDAHTAEVLSVRSKDASRRRERR